MATEEVGLEADARLVLQAITNDDDNYVDCDDVFFPPGAGQRAPPSTSTRLPMVCVRRLPGILYSLLGAVCCFLYSRTSTVRTGVHCVRLCVTQSTALSEDSSFHRRPHDHIIIMYTVLFRVSTKLSLKWVSKDDHTHMMLIYLSCR